MAGNGSPADKEAKTSNAIPNPGRQDAAGVFYASPVPNIVGWNSFRQHCIGLRGEHGEQIHIRKSCHPNAGQQKLLRALGLEWLPGKTEKTIVTT